MQRHSNTTMESFVGRPSRDGPTTALRLLITLLASVMMAAMAGIGMGFAVQETSQGNPPAVECDGIDNYLNKFEMGESGGHWDIGGTTETPDGTFNSDDGFSISWSGTTLTWTSTTPVSFIVVKGGSTHGNGALGYSVAVDVSGATGGTIDVATELGSGDTRLAGLSHVTFCSGQDEPPPTITYSESFSSACAQATLTIQNTSPDEVDITFWWQVDTGDVTFLTLGAGQQHTENFAIPTNGSIEVNVSVDTTGDEQADDSWTHVAQWQDCSGGGGGGGVLTTTATAPPPVNEPAAVASFSCDTGGSVLLDNTGSDEAVDFEVTVDGATIVVTVDAGQALSVPIDVPEDTTVIVSVAALGDQLVDGEQLTANCIEVLPEVIDAPEPEPEPEPAPLPVEVLPEVIDRPEGAPQPQAEPETLPATGASSITVALLGAGLAAAGSALLASDRRRRRGDVSG